MADNSQNAPNQPMTIEDLSNAYQQIQIQFNNAQAQVLGLRNELEATKNQLITTQGNLQAIQAHPAQSVKPRKPESFKGKGSIKSWITQVTNYIGNAPEPQAITVAVSYLDGPAHEWWLGFKDTEEGRAIQTWRQLQEALIRRFENLNKIKIARDKLERWRQIKDVPAFNEDFQKILLDIPNITIEEQIDRYARGLKNYIWRELCTKEYASLSELMKDAERVESAHRRFGKASPKIGSNDKVKHQRSNGPVPMEIGNVQLKKLSAAERDMCRKEGTCFRCREKGHMANKCPKGQGN